MCFNVFQCFSMHFECVSDVFVETVFFLEHSRFWALYGPLLVTIVLVAENRVERSLLALRTAIGIKLRFPFRFDIEKK